MTSSETGAPAEVRYAGFGRRLAAILIDNVLLFVTLGSVIDLLPAESIEGPDAPTPGAVLAAALVFTLWFNYFPFCEWRWGRTLGKELMRIRVVSAADGGPVRLGVAGLRNLARIVDALLIGPLLILTSDRQQRLGDRLAGTVVVRRSEDRRPAPPPPPGPPLPAEPTAQRPEVPGAVWGPLQAVLAAVGALIGATTLGLVVVLPFDPDLESTAAGLVLQGLLGAGFITASLLVASRFSLARVNEGIEALGLGSVQWSHLGWGVLGWLAYLVVTLIYVSIVGVPEQDDIAGELGIDESAVSLAAVVFLICFFGPLAEEMVFRGLIFGAFRARYSFVPAALISAALFGLVHAPTGITTVVPLAIFGFALAWVYERTGSLWPAVVAHIINNSLVVLPTILD